ncbi:MAG: TIGR04283 family arsenosugar biosynthesis glycosyltransferase [Thermodesulfobacteriota bacterium]|nr:TIGR04283 family arsenosugar biosynthesis glycosyltransferase [Thermodesulfobacteriota bacterium]
MPINFKEHLIVFTRYPEPGKTKTRLIPMLGAESAADLQRKMTEHTLLQVKRLPTRCELSVEIRYDGGDKNLMQNWLGQDFDYRPQGSGNLGLRMKCSLEDSFRAGATEAVIIGTDIPDITDVIIQKAFDALKLKNLVLGPAKDGGYYLIGLQKNSLSKAIPDLFTGINWGAGDVLEKTIKIAKNSGLSFTLLDVLKDVDHPEDLMAWKRSQNLSNHDFNPDRISIIIPAINEANNIAKTIESIGSGDKKEVIVVDGGSNDDTVRISKSLGARVITSTPPRARQMNRGAAQATGDVLVFLHADTRLPEKFEDFIFNSFKQPGTIAGAFELRIDSPMPGLRLIERLANWRSRFFKMPYCDQAIFISSRVFHQIGGFPDIPIMEDFELVRRLQKKGEIVTLPVPVFTSPRRWQNLGILQTTLINQLVIAAYFMGIAPEVIARWYGRGKSVSERS